MGSCGGAGACQSHCTSQDEKESDEHNTRKKLESLSVASAPSPAICTKCGVEERCFNALCSGCFRSHLYGKFKLAVTSNAMISPADNVLVAVSGGPASRVALQFVHEMQHKALESWEASKASSLPVFGVGVAFIDESVISPDPSHEIDKTIEEFRSAVLDLSPPRKLLHITPIENICSPDSKNGVSRLNQLLGAIADETGKEDFLRYLRMLSLQKVALENKYNKLVLGSCTSSMARHVLSATVKGQGYSLPADVQYVDARWKVPIVLPLRDCLEQELSTLCHLDGLKTHQPLNRPCTDINGLVSSFVARLLDENPSRERTIVRTAGKLMPFSFNKFVEDGYHDFLPSRLRCKFQNMKSDKSTPAEVLCAICGSPLSESDLQGAKNIDGGSHTSLEAFVTHCCQSCCFQILPKEAIYLENFYAELPQLMTDKEKDGVPTDPCWLREQIKDCLLSDDEDGT